MTWDKDSVKQLRQILDLTQIQFAELLGCRQQTISEWEQGLYAPANAYGKLLSQIKVRSLVSDTLILQNRPLNKAIDIKEGAEFFDDPNENQYERPFDPAID